MLAETIGTCFLGKTVKNGLLINLTYAF